MKRAVRGNCEPSGAERPKAWGGGRVGGFRVVRPRGTGPCARRAPAHSSIRGSHSCECHGAVRFPPDFQFQYQSKWSQERGTAGNSNHEFVGNSNLTEGGCVRETIQGGAVCKKFTHSCRQKEDLRGCCRTRSTHATVLRTTPPPYVPPEAADALAIAAATLAAAASSNSRSIRSSSSSCWTTFEGRARKDRRARQNQ